MAKVGIYTSNTCPYCVRAKALLAQKGVDFTEYNVENEPGGREGMIKRSGGMRTVPQIFINDRHIGGSDDLAKLDIQGKLDPLLKE